MGEGRRTLFLYRAAVFLSAFLLFQIQPIIAKALLPAFGGSYLVWGACMAFFQGVLLLGYGYVHIAQSRLGVVRYSRLHAILLLVPLLLMPLHFEWLGRVDSERSMFLQVFALLSVTIGLPFFVLSTGSLLLQSWLANSALPERENPYVLYSASNAGSILALLTYPILFEPTMSLKTQAFLWAVLYVGMVLLMLGCLPPKAGRAAADSDEPDGERTPLAEMISWFLLSAAGCATLLAVTNALTFDVASAPFLWIIPLSLYLLTFVLLFKKAPWCPEWIGKAFVFAVIAGVAMHLLTMARWEVPVFASLLVHSAILFLVCMRCHGLLAARKPRGVRELTRYYFILSVGGFVGSVVVSGIVPVVADNLIEYPLALAAAALAIALASSGPSENLLARVRSGLDGANASVGFVFATAMVMFGAPWLGQLMGLDARLLLVPLLGGLGFLVLAAKKNPLQIALVVAVIAAMSGVTEQLVTGGQNMTRHRNYYGIYKIYDHAGLRYMQHGTTLHGRQYLAPEKAAIPLSYYHPTTPAAELMRSRRVPCARVGMIGLGTGALAVSMASGSRFDVFELDPDNLALAEQHFSFLSQARDAGVETAFHSGDGRLALAKYPDAAFDLLIVDAFSSGAIPVHLLTCEALTEYLRCVGPNGVVLFHISNKFVNLEPLLAADARAIGCHILAKTNQGSVDPDADLTTWVAITRSEPAMRVLQNDLQWRAPMAAQLPAPWTDQYSNVLALFL